jgi:hypothetical protein
VDPALSPARVAIDLVLKGHEPCPAVAIDRHWTLVASNGATAPMLVGIADVLLQPPVNVLRLTLHPDGLAPRIVNYHEWRAHLLDRVRRQIDASADPVLVDLLAELRAYPPPPGDGQEPRTSRDYAGIAVPFELRTDAGVLAFISTTTVFGTPMDITLSELALETFFPADEATARVMNGKWEKGKGKWEGVSLSAS